VVRKGALFVFVICFTALDAIGGNGPLARLFERLRPC
jgi:hypothetical protein